MVSDLDQNKAAPVHGLFAGIVRDILRNRVRLPSMPDVALQIRASMQQPNYTATTVAKAIKADAGTSAYLVRVANSALYGGRAPVETLDGAVVRLGMDTTRSLVTAHALRSMFRTRNRTLGRIMQESWQGSARRAALAFIIADRCPGFDPDRAMLAGLLQDIGTLPLLSALESRKELPDAERLWETIESFSATVGVHLLTFWEFEDDMIEVVRSRKDWFRDSSEAADLADIVMVARLHAAVGTPEMYRQPTINHVPAFVKLPLGELGPDQSLAFLREAEADVRELMQMLGV